MSPSWLKVALLTAGLSVVPVYAFADTAPDAAPLEKGAGKEKGKHFPMATAKFKEVVEKRIAKVKERVAERMEKRNVPADKRREIMADVDAGAAKVRAAADQAGKDGTITAEEAKTVRGVRIINCARGGLVDELALAEAIEIEEEREAPAAIEVGPDA